MAAAEPVTLKVLAKELGLNVSTVSRVLNDPAGPDSKWASAQTTARIFALARERGYTRNPHAASLRTARSNMVGVIVPRLQDFVLATMYEGVDEAATEQGLFTVVANSLDKAETQRAKAEMLLERRADGLIFGDAHLTEPYLEELKGRGVPFALINRTCGEHLSVTCDDYAGGRLVAEHLISTGRTRFGVIAGDPTTSTSQDRTRGFLDVMREKGINVLEDRIIHGGFDAAAGQKAAIGLLAHPEKPEAIFAVNDFAAIGALGVLQERGIRVPDDIALAGFNDTPLAAGVNLTTVRSPMHEIGRQGLQTLQHLIGGGTVASTKLAPTLIVRASG
ncbi:LacI family DNA-binding transcriptional regulator [Arthrobacter mangrovi]|uniref:LacI family transcriptional regulator n=1 Tax=Arthrobacter mangrovi TaxID=2966350 RepID=A0ABQ5MTA4_9MICC|nr:LacI family DNA-binding transcriptional regulator [Arthrobacter mangrovi]GLB67183.1 LacI family transcriptional regulator [Arthrobacter mangrovi]